jgi:hypothetical protein
VLGVIAYVTSSLTGGTDHGSTISVSRNLGDQRTP